MDKRQCKTLHSERSLLTTRRSQRHYWFLQEAVYHQIETESGITSLTQQEATEAYHSRLEMWECARKNIHKVAWDPQEN